MVNKCRSYFQAKTRYFWLQSVDIIDSFKFSVVLCIVSYTYHCGYESDHRGVSVRHNIQVGMSDAVKQCSNKEDILLREKKSTKH